MKEKLSFKKEYLPRTIFHICNFAFFTIVLVVMLIPIWKIVVDSLDESARHGIFLWPNRFSVEAYQHILRSRTLYQPFFISCFVTIVGTFFGLCVCTTAAYVLIHKQLPGQKLLSWSLLFTMIFSGGLIPTYLTMRMLGLVNTLWVILLPGAVSIFNIILMRNFFEGIPSSLFESAEIDGCSPVGVYFRIVLPLSVPALASIGLFYAVSFWNEYTSFVIYITDSNLFNFQVRLRALIIEDQSLPGGQSIAKSVQNAVIVVATVPFMLVYPFIQRYFVTGITMGAVKE